MSGHSGTDSSKRPSKVRAVCRLLPVVFAPEVPGATTASRTGPAWRWLEIDWGVTCRVFCQRACGARDLCTLVVELESAPLRSVGCVEAHEQWQRQRQPVSLAERRSGDRRGRA